MNTNRYDGQSSNVYHDQSNTHLDKSRSHTRSSCSIDRVGATSIQRNKHPRIMIMGFAKSGTTALRISLLMHPNVTGCNCELRFFDLHYSDGLCQYISKIKNPEPSQIILEDSPGYVLHPRVVFPRLFESLRQFNLKLSDLKFIVILRHPVVRAISGFLQRQQTKEFDEVAIYSNGEPNLSHSSIKKSRYSYYVKQVLEFVPLNQICFVNGDMLRTDPVLLMNKLEKCLGLPLKISSRNYKYNKERKLFCFVINNKVECPTKGKGRPHPAINKRTADILMKLYEPYNKELYNITGEDYGWDYNYDGIDIKN